jgi:periplasmic protein TonB
MFEDSLIESGNKLKTKRGLTTTFTFFLEIILVGIMVLIPLLFTEALPKAQLLTGLVAPPPPPPPPPPPAAVVKVVKIQTNMINDQLRTPTKIPKKIEIIKEEEAPPQMAGVMGGVPGGVPGGTMNGVLNGIVSSNAVAPKIAAAPTRVRVSQGVTSGLLINHPQPTYPPLAKQARISGAVVLQAEISKDGSIQNLHVLSGHPMLVPSALEAVKRWKYKPYILNGEPVEVETTITVNFTLAG